MNAWLLVALLLMVAGLAPCVAATARGEPLRRLVGANLLSAVLVGVLLLLAQGLGRSAYVDVALVLAVLSPAGTLVFTRLLSPDEAERADEAGRSSQAGRADEAGRSSQAGRADEAGKPAEAGSGADGRRERRRVPDDPS